METERRTGKRKRNKPPLPFRIILFVCFFSIYLNGFIKIVVLSPFFHTTRVVSLFVSFGRVWLMDPPSHPNMHHVIFAFFCFCAFVFPSFGYTTLCHMKGVFMRFPKFEKKEDP
mmetsp:Transcript_39800/g.102511  ORF Transcript_39800/g.102511 Transcript_39800/m.102511 type:complete len:114 (-) Transcript_39800:254-595(-)